MGVPRPDVKFHLDPPDKAALKIFADHRGLTQGELAEQIVKGWLESHVHDASVLAAELTVAGVISPEQAAAGKGRK